MQQLNLRKEINQAVPLFKLHLPYDEADHVFNIGLNLLTGGSCLDHLETRRTDEAYLNALGAERIPDPTTAGDFCRRFNEAIVLKLMEALNQVRLQVWQQQPDEFFDVAIIEADGSLVETCGDKKEGIGMNYKKQWGYHSLIITLANTGETLYVVNRSGNRPIHERAPYFIDLAIQLCRKAGFRKIIVRGDTDFALTEYFDRWTNDGVEFGRGTKSGCLGLGLEWEEFVAERVVRAGSEGNDEHQAIWQELTDRNLLRLLAELGDAEHADAELGESWSCTKRSFSRQRRTTPEPDRRSLRLAVAAADLRDRTSRKTRRWYPSK